MEYIYRYAYGILYIYIRHVSHVILYRQRYIRGDFIYFMNLNSERFDPSQIVTAWCNFPLQPDVMYSEEPTKFMVPVLMMGTDWASRTKKNTPYMIWDQSSTACLTSINPWFIRCFRNRNFPTYSTQYESDGFLWFYFHCWQDKLFLSWNPNLTNKIH